MKRQYLLSLLCLLAAVAVAACSSNENAKQAFLTSGDRYASQDKFQEAIVQYRNAIQRDPRFAAARLKLARIYERTGDTQNAYREFVRAADLLPADDDAQLQAGRYLFMARQFEDAKTRARTVLDRSPKNVTARILLGNSLAGLKDLDAAVTEMETAAADSPGVATPQINIGYLRLARGDKGEAEEAFKQAIETDATSMPARLALANFYLADARSSDAEQTLKDALAINPNDTLANRAMAVFYMKTKRAPEAEPYVKAAAASVGDGRSQLALVDYYVLSNRDEEATRVLNDLVAPAADTFAEASTRLAEIEGRQGHSGEAYARLDQVLAREPKNARALAIRGRLRLADKKLPEATSDLKAALALEPSAIAVRLLLAAAYQAANASDAAIKEYETILKSTPSSAQAQFQLARLYLSAGKPELAIEYADRAVAAAPASLEARLLLGRALTAHGDGERAAAELQRLTQEFPTSAEVRAALGTLHLRAQKWVDARRWFDAALALDSSSVEATDGLVNVDLATKRPAEARQRLDTRVAQTPADPAMNLAAAAGYARLGDTRRAEEILLKTIEDEPSRLPAYVLLGRLYLSQNRMGEAQQQFETLLTKEPSSVGTATMLGMILETRGRQADAQKMYERTLQMDPAAAVAANNLAWIYASNGANLDIALQLAQAATRKLPNEAAINDTLGWIYYKKDMAAQAVAAFQQSVQKTPTNPEFQFHLGLAYVKAGDTSRAKDALSSALKLNPTFKSADEARQLLASLGASTATETGQAGRQPEKH